MRFGKENRQKLPSYVAAAVVVSLSSISAQAFTCEDVRSLTKEQQNYWSQRLQLSASQRHAIWVACYQKYRGVQLRVAHR
jgi:hypothetical protein